ncbi:MAG: serine protease [Deltaproteobacteria bacterium]|nr:serine protease [Deltaproteobacteria bacterium]
MGKDLILPIVLQVIGIVVVFAEVIIPSGGLLAIMASGLFGYSLYMVFTGISTAMGMGFVAADLVILPIVIVYSFKVLAKSPATLSTELSSDKGFTSQSVELEELLGLEGVATSDLRPSGTALIDKKRVDVVSRGDYISKSTKIVVHKITGNQIIVKKL